MQSCELSIALYSSAPEPKLQELPASYHAMLPGRQVRQALVRTRFDIHAMYKFVHALRSPLSRARCSSPARITITFGRKARECGGNARSPT